MENRKKPNEVKIISFQETYAQDGSVYICNDSRTNILGLGDDGKIYGYIIKTNEWYLIN